MRALWVVLAGSLVCITAGVVALLGVGSDWT